MKIKILSIFYLFSAIFINQKIFADSKYLYFPFQNGVGYVTATELTPNIAVLVPLAIKYISVYDGAKSNSGTITYYSPLDNKIKNLSLSKLLSPDQLNALPQFAFAIDQQSIYMPQGKPTLFKTYSIGPTNTSAVVVTPFAYNNKIFVLLGPQPGIVGTDCVVTDTTTKKDIITFHLKDLPMAGIMDQITWISDHQILCSSWTRRHFLYFLIDTSTQKFVNSDQLKDMLFFSFIKNKLMLYFKGDDNKINFHDFKYQ